MSLKGSLVNLLWGRVIELVAEQKYEFGFHCNEIGFYYKMNNEIKMKCLPEVGREMP